MQIYISVTQINRCPFGLVFTTVSQVGELKFRKGYGFTGIWVRKEPASETACSSTISKVLTPIHQLVKEMILTPIRQQKEMIER